MQTWFKPRDNSGHLCQMIYHRAGAIPRRVVPHGCSDVRPLGKQKTARTKEKQMEEG